MPTRSNCSSCRANLGATAEGEEIVANIGRFGPYVKYGAKYVSLKVDDPYTVTLERALEVIREKEIADANRLILDFPDAGIQVLNGRYGPYITDKTRNAKIPKDRDPKSLTLEKCQSLLAAAPLRRFGKWGRKGKNAKRGAAGQSRRQGRRRGIDGRRLRRGRSPPRSKTTTDQGRASRRPRRPRRRPLPSPRKGSPRRSRDSP